MVIMQKGHSVRVSVGRANPFGFHPRQRLPVHFDMGHDIMIFGRSIGLIDLHDIDQLAACAVHAIARDITCRVRDDRFHGCVSWLP